ncbi:19461_t:CDS:1, partial [Gigaspora margarita]
RLLGGLALNIARLIKMLKNEEHALSHKFNNQNAGFVYVFVDNSNVFIK